MNVDAKISRRRMLQLTGVSTLVAGAALSGCSSSTTDDGQGETTTPTTYKLTVYDPSGSTEITQTFAPRLDSLEGKTIAIIGNGMWQEPRTSQVIEDAIHTKYPTATVIPPDQFPRHTDNLTKANNGIPEQLESLGADAAIIGNAG